MRTYGVPSEALIDNGEQFTGRFTKPRPAEVLFERVCREHGITAKLTGPYSPTTTEKVERWHRTLRRELLDVAGPFADLPSVQAAITAWVHAYTHARPHQAWTSPLPPACSAWRVPDREPAAAAPRPEPGPAAAAGPVPRLVPSPSGGAVEFETVISPAGVLSVLPRVQRLKMGQALAEQVARVWADEVIVHVTVGGQLVKTAPSSLDAEDLAELRMRGADRGGPAARDARPGPGWCPAGRRRDRGGPDRRRQRDRRPGRAQGQDRPGTGCQDAVSASQSRRWMGKPLAGVTLNVAVRCSAGKLIAVSCSSTRHWPSSSVQGNSWSGVSMMAPGGRGPVRATLIRPEAL